jgi:hypothetical protein
LTFFGDSASIPEKKQPVPSTRGMDGTGWKKGWFQSAMPGGSACTLRTMVRQDDGREPSTLPDSARPIG